MPSSATRGNRHGGRCLRAMFDPELRATRTHLAPALLSALVLGSCGGGETQDANEPEGDFRVELVRASFPSDQSLAQRSDLEITVRNAERERSVPNIAVTVQGFDERVDNADESDPSRPVFVINGRQREIGTYPEAKEAAPRGETAYNGTWTLGRLRPGQSKTFRWNVTAVRPGPYRLSYEVAAGLDGKARAVPAGGRPLKGLFSGEVDGEAPDTQIGEDGRSIVRGAR
jgi:hypothetical protein